MKLYNPENYAYMYGKLRWIIQDIALETLIADISLG